MQKGAIVGFLFSILVGTVALSGCGDGEQPTGPGTTAGAAGTGGGGTNGGAGMTGGMSGTGGTAGTGGMTGGGGTGGTAPTGGGGTGGKPECMSPAECGISDACHSYTCDAGMCKEVFTPAGTKIPAQVNGDCKTNTCDGNGGIVSGDDDTDVFDDQNDCTDDTCVGGAPVNNAKAEGTMCASGSGKLCDGAKKCVECLAAADCMTGVCAMDHTCAPAACADLLKNGSETDVDCGGPVCGKCATGKVCALGSDCMEGVCDPATLTCSASTCMDKVKNGMETDVDCGGPTCDDCLTGKACASPTDCVSLVCSGNPLVCQAPSCMDNVKNQDETDVDCGGAVCNDCANGKLCLGAGDCVSGVCSGNPQTCQVPTCSDSVKNGNETGVDCGGATCPSCVNGQPCNANSDCMSMFCNAAKLCAMPTCNDMAKNGMETDVDCGGPTCPDCANGKTCASGADCVSTFCYGNPLVCQPNLNGCTAADFVDMTGQSAVGISFGGFFYTPKCVKVSAGTNVTWSGSFMSHPLQGGMVVNNVPFPDNSKIPLTNTGSMSTINFSGAGTFPYYCQFHVNSMQGVVLVVP